MKNRGIGTRKLYIYGILVALLGVFVIAGWIFDIPVLKSVIPGYSTMKLNTALSFVLLGLGFAGIQSDRPMRIKAGIILSLTCLIVGLITASEYIFQSNLGIDEFFVKDETALILGYPYPGRMAAATAFNFILLSTSLLLVTSTYKVARVVGQQLIQLAIGIAIIAIVGYLYDVPSFYKLSFLTSMSIHTSVSFSVLGIAALFLNPSIGITNLFIGDKIGHVMARRLVPLMLVMFLVLGLLGGKAYKASLVSVDFGIAMFAFMAALVGLFLIWNTARNLNRVDKKRSEAEEALQEFNKSLEATVSLRTKELEDSLNRIQTLSERFKIATMGAKMGIWDFDVVKNELIWDDTMYALYGVDKKDFSGVYDAWQATVHPDDAAAADQTVNEALKSGDELNIEFRVLLKDKSVRYIKGRAAIKRDNRGNAVRMTGVNWDISDLKIAEEKLEESMRMNRVFVDQAPSAIAMFDTEMRYIAASKEWIKDYGLEGKEIIGKSHYVIFPEIGEDWKAIHQECLAGGVNQCEEASFERADGSVQWITWDVRPWFISDGHIGGILMYTADITQAKEREQERRRMEEILDKTTDVARIGGWEVDLLRNKILWTPMTKEIHEVPADFQPNMETAIDFFKEGESRTIINEAVTAAIEYGTPYDVEVQLVTGKGNEIWTRAMGQAEFKEGKCIRLYGVFQDIDQRKKEQNELANSEAQFRGAFEFSAIGMALVSLEGKWLRVNSQIPAMLGYSEKELLQKTFQEITHPDDLENDIDLVKRTLRGEINSYNLEKRYFHKNGSVVWGLLSVSLLRDTGGNPVHFISQIEDITKRKLAEEEVRDLNQQMTAIFDSGTQVSIIGTDPNGLITYFSKGSETLLGYASEEMVGLRTPAILHMKEEVEKRGNELTKKFARKIEGFDVFVEVARQEKFESREWTYRRKDGTTFPVQLVVTAIRDEFSVITGFLGIATDITERKESEDKFKGLLESAPDAMVIVDREGKIVIVNSQTIKLFGYTREELEGRPVELLIPTRFSQVHKGHRDMYFHNPLTRPMGEDLELYGQKKDGHEFAIEISLSPIETKEGTLVSAAIRDITERKAAQRSLEEMAADLTNRNKQLANFAHITSHNLRAPVSNLNSLLSIYHTVEDQLEKKEIFDRFEKVISHLSSTLNELVEALKIKENADLDRAHLFFEDVLKKTGEIMTAEIWETGAKITSDFKEVPKIDYNQGYLESIFQNLIGNAIKYRSPDRAPEIFIKTYLEDNRPVITFTDNGLGIDLNRHGNKIFGLHKTFHRHAEAKGVGLFITKTQVEAMGGEIGVESEVGKGSTFTIRFKKNEI